MHEVWLDVQLLKDDVLPLPLMQWSELCLHHQQ